MANKFFKNMTTAVLLFYTANAWALQIKELSPDGEAEGVISLRDLTRIKVSEDRIKSIKVNHGEIELLEDQDLGEVYLKPSNRNGTPINMFIITEKGRTYKLLMLPKNIPSEQIFIKNQDVTASTEQEKTTKEVVLVSERDYE